MGATKKVLWMLVLLATMDLLAGRQLSDGMPLSHALVRQQAHTETVTAQARSTRPERMVSATARTERVASSYSERP